MTDNLKEKIIIRSIKVYKNREEWADDYVQDNYQDAIEYMKEYFDKLFPTATGSGAGTSQSYFFDFDASLSNSIYGNSTTVQPPALVVNIWKRTA